MSNQPLDVVAVVVTYGSRSAFVTKVVGALNTEGVRFVFVVANGCSSDVLSELDRIEGADLVVLPRNTGSAGGYTAGLEAALNRGAELIWLLDDDNLPNPGCLSLLTSALDERSSAAMPMRPEPLFERSANGISVPAPGSFLYFDIIERLRSRLRPAARRAVRTLPYAPYGGLLLKSAAVRRAGLPNSTYVLYEDDTEFTARLAESVGDIRFVPEAQITDIDAKWNGHGSVVYGASRIRQYYAVRNRVRFDYSRVRSRSLGLRARFVFNAILFVAVSMVRDSPSFQIGALNTFFRAVWDGLREVGGVAPEELIANSLDLSEMPSAWACQEENR